MSKLSRISLAVFALALLTAWAPAQVRVINAVWGAEGRYDNVTRRVQDLANMGRYSFEVDRDTLRSDPAKGERKTLRIQYQTRSGTYNESVREGDVFKFRGVSGGWGGSGGSSGGGWGGSGGSSGGGWGGSGGSGGGWGGGGGSGNWGCWNPWYPGSWPGASYTVFTIKNVSGKFVTVYHTDRHGEWRFVRQIQNGDERDFRSPVGERWLVLGYQNQILTSFRARPQMDVVKIK